MPQSGYSADGAWWWNGSNWQAVVQPGPPRSPDGRWVWTGSAWYPQPAVAGRWWWDGRGWQFAPSLAPAARPLVAAPLKKRRRRPRLLASMLVVALVTALVGAGRFDLLTSSDGFLDPASAEQVLAGLDAPVSVPQANLLPLFESAPAPPAPQQVAVPPLGLGTKLLTGATVPLPGHVDVQADPTVPADFVAYVESAVGAGIAQFDSYYADPTFNFTAATATAHFGLLITVNRAPFDALAHTRSFRSGFMDPCPNHPADANACVPRVMIYFDPAKWIAGEYSPMNPPRIEHEVFHVAHFYLLRALGKAALFSIPGYYWQTEGFATFTQRNVPDPAAYLSFTTELLDLGYFSWPKVTDFSYEDSYAAAPFLDEMVFRAEGDKSLLLKWLRSASTGTPSSLGLMATFAGNDTSIDLAKFQKLWLGSMVDLSFPGLLPLTDGRTAPLGRALPKPAATVTKDSLPATATLTVAPIAAQAVSIKFESLPDEKDVKNLRVHLASDLPANERAIVMLVKGEPGKDLTACYQGLPGNAVAAAAARQCFRSSARLLDVVTKGNNTGVKVSVGALKRFSPDLGKLSVVAFVAHTIADLSAPGLQPMHATLTVAKDLPDDATLALDVSGDVSGHLVADHLHRTDNGFLSVGSSTCHLQQGGWLWLDWEPSLGGQTYDFSVQIHGFHGPGVYANGADNQPPSSSLGLVRLDKNQPGWVDDGKGSVTIKSDGQSGTFAATLTWVTNGQIIRQVAVSGSFACSIVIA